MRKLFYIIICLIISSSVIAADGIFTKIIVGNSPYVDSQAKVTLVAADTYAAAQGRSLYITKNYISTTGTMTFTSNVVIEGGTLTCSGGKYYFTKTFNAPYKEVFPGCAAGDVTFGNGSIEYVYAEWFNGDIKKALGAWHRLQLLDGNYTLDKNIHGTTYLNSTNYELQYLIQGKGRGSFINVDHYDDESYLFKLNEDAGGNMVIGYPGHPRLIIQDVYFFAEAMAGHDGSTAARLLWFNTASTHLLRTRLRGFKWGMTGTGYTDNMRLDMVMHILPVTGGWLYKQTSNGDGLVVQNVFVNPTAGAGTISLTKCAGATIHTIGGVYEFIMSYGIVLHGSHFEDSLATAITIKGSSVTIADNFFYDAYGYIPIVIDDSNTSDNHHSNVVLRNNKFITHQFASTTTRTYDIDITNLVQHSRVVFDYNSAGFIRHGGWVDSGIGIRVWPLDAENVLKMPYFSGHVERRAVDDTNFKITPVGQGNYFVENVPSIPLIYSATSTTSTFVAIGSMTTGTYYYQAVTYNLIGNSGHTTEVQMVVTENNSAGLLYINNGGSYLRLRLWRGTSAGVYDRYVDVPVTTKNLIQVYDTGETFMGIPWETTGVPAVPGSIAYKGIYNNGRKIIEASSRPVIGAFTAGDLAFNTSTGTGTISGWRCVTSGSPGTWEIMGQSGLLTSIASAPTWTGQMALSGSEFYMATGVTSTLNWKQITN